MRDPRKNPEVLHVVDPHGRIRAVSFGEGINHVLVDRAGVIRPESRAAGHVTLEELCNADSWQVWCDFIKALAEGAEAAEPTDWLPAEVRRRRAEVPKRKTWTPPPAPGDRSRAT